MGSPRFGNLSVNIQSVSGPGCHLVSELLSVALPETISGIDSQQPIVDEEYIYIVVT